MRETYRQSKWTQVKRCGNDIKMYHSVKGNLNTINENLLQLLEFLQEARTIDETAEHFNVDKPAIEGIIGKLTDQAFVVRNDEEYSFDRFTGCTDMDELSLRLFITEKCNFKCVYCFESSQHGNDMTLEKAFDSVYAFSDFFKIKEKTWGKIKVNFYGGEPLLNWRLVPETVELLKREIDPHTSQLVISLNTNGTMMTGDIAKYLVDNRVLVFLSLDGFEEQHNAMRKFHSGRGTYQAVLKGLDTLMSAADSEYVSKHLSILCTVSKNNVNDSLEFARFLQKKGIKNMAFNVASMCLSHVKEGRDSEHDVAIDDFYGKAIDLYELSREVGMNIGGSWGQLRNAVIDGNLKYCTAVGNEFDVAIDGRVFPCPMVYEMKEHEIGKIENKTFYPNPSYYKWKERISPNIPGCQSCDIIGICRGGCPAISAGLHADIYQPEGCGMYKKFANYFVERLPD